MLNGIHLGLLAAQLINLVLIGLWFALIFSAMRRLSRLPLSAAQLALWTALIFFVPFLGALALLLTYPASSSSGAR